MTVARRIAGVAVLAVLFSVGSWAQLTKGIRGKVYDRDGKPAAGVTVVFEDLVTASNHYEVTTDDNGNFTRAGLPYSDKGYKVTVQLPGLPPVTKVEKPKLMDPVDMVFDMRKDVVLQETKASPAAEAKTLYEMGDFEGALAKANEAIAEKDNLKAALFFKAAATDKMGDTDGAIAAFEAYQKDYPEESAVLGMLARLYDEKGDAKKADFYKKAYAAKGGKIEGQTYNDGVKALNAGEFAKGADLFRKAIQENAADADSHRELARCLVQMGDYKATIAELQTYLKMKPSADDAATWQQAITGLQAMIEQQENPKKK